MRCPYQTKVIHKPEDTEGYVKIFAFDKVLKIVCELKRKQKEGKA